MTTNPRPTNPLPDSRTPWTDALPKNGSFQVAGPAGWFARRAMQVNPEIEPNLRRTVKSVVGSQFTDSELTALENQALDAAELKDLQVLQGIEADTPVIVNPSQKARIDRLLGKMGNDDLGRRARDAYGEGLRSGKIRVR